MLNVENLDLHYGHSQILDGVSVTAELSPPIPEMEV